MSDTSTQSSEHSHSPARAGGSGLGHKLGPLPVWGWVVVAVGAYLLYHYLKNRNASNTATAADGTVNGTDNASSLLGTEGATVNGAGQIVDTATGSILGSASGGTSTSAADTTTPEGWLSAAQQALYSLGYDSGTADQALMDYVSGTPLNPTEYGIVESAFKTIGAAPSTLGLPQLQAAAVTSAPAATQPAAVGSSPPGDAPPSASSIFGKMIGSVIAVIPTGGTNSLASGWTYVTNQGYVYNYQSPYFGGTNGGAIGGAVAGNIVDAVPITTGPNAGGYSLINAAGQTYNFGPAANAASGQYAAQPAPAAAA